MNLFQTASSLTTPPPTYLGVSIPVIIICVASLVKVVRNWQIGRFPQGFRMVQGLILVTVIRLAAFIFTYISWQREPVFSTSLLILDQAVSFISILSIFWVWNFPEPSREVDPAVLALILFSAILSVGQIAILPNLMESIFGTITFWQGITAVILIVSCVLILIRKPNLWSYGLSMGVILLAGSIVSILRNELTALYFAHLTSYPLLLILGDRFLIGEQILDDSTSEEDEIRRKVSVDFDILNIIERLFDESDPAGILYKIAQATAYLILSDLTLVIDTPDKHGKMRIIAGFDLIREEPLQALTLDSRSIPLLSNYIQRGKLLHIPASSTSRDLTHLSKMLQLSKPGHLLAAPVHVAGANKTIGVVLFSPFSNRPWTKDDQKYITLLCSLFESAFSHHLVSQDSESESVKNTIRDLTSQLAKLTQDKQVVKEEMAVLSKDHQNLLLEQDVLKTKYEGLLNWGNSLERHLASLVDLSDKESTQALRKYINVIEKEVQKDKSEDFKIEIDEEMLASTETEEADPDSGRPADLLEAIESCLEDVKSELEEKELTTALDLPDDTPLLKMNHALFREIFSFLLSNAIEENNTGGEIKIKTQVYEEDQKQHFAHINVSDQGDGYFPDEIAAVLNDRLTTEQQEKLTQVMTNLYVTKNLVENEGGRMWVESKPGDGTTVSLLLAFM